MRPRVAVLVALVIISAPGRAAVVAIPPGHRLAVLEEWALVVHDPLTGSQTTLVQWVFEGTNETFGVLLPTPAPAKSIRVVPDRLQSGIAARLHPQAKSRRSLDMKLTSWLFQCGMRPAGEMPKEGSDARQTRIVGEGLALGNDALPLHDWLLDHGLTISPAQTAWLTRLRARGWSVNAVLIEPQAIEEGSETPTRLRGPVLAVTHDASEPSFAAGTPPFELTGGPDAFPHPIELAILSEASAKIVNQPDARPFYADTISGRDLLQLGADSGGLPWAFRRDGAMTAFLLSPPPGEGVFRIAPTEPLGPLGPEPIPYRRPYRLELPIEAPVIVLAIGWWLVVRRRRAHQGSRLRLDTS